MRKYGNYSDVPNNHEALLGTMQVLVGLEKKGCSSAQPKKTTFQKCAFNCKVQI